MAVLILDEDGAWRIDIFLEPVEFWPYTTYVTDVVMSGPRKQFDDLNKYLIDEFKRAGIKAHEENKCAFGLKDGDGKMWYFGFKDFRFSLGMGVRSDSWIKPLVKDKESK